MKGRKTPVERELDCVARKEARLRRQAMEYRAAVWKEDLERRIPAKVYDGLQKAFCKAFELIFERGTALIERTYSRRELEQDFQVRDYAVRLKGGRKEFRALRANAGQRNLINLAVSTAEGVALGALGIGLPDVALFVSTLFRGTYETAVQYGFSYDTPEERMFILKLLEASTARGADWIACNQAVDRWLDGEAETGEEAFRAQLRRTADAFAVDLLLAKFVQGLPLVGIAGGLANPVCYRRVLRYVQLKYQKRYLLQRAAEAQEGACHGTA